MSMNALQKWNNQDSVIIPDNHQVCSNTQNESLLNAPVTGDVQVQVQGYLFI